MITLPYSLENIHETNLFKRHDGLEEHDGAVT